MPNNHASCTPGKNVQSTSDDPRIRGPQLFAQTPEKESSGEAVFLLLLGVHYYDFVAVITIVFTVLDEVTP